MNQETVVILSNDSDENPFNFTQRLDAALQIKNGWLIALDKITFSQYISIDGNEPHSQIPVCIQLRDIVKPVSYGNTTLPVLRILNYKAKRDYAFNQSEILYCSAKEGFYKNIHVELTYVDGKPIVDDNCGIITLTLRLKQTAY